MSELIKATKTTGLSKRKKAEAVKLETKPVQSGNLSHSDILRLIDSGLLKETADLTADEHEALTSQDEFILDYIQKARDAVAAMRTAHDEKIETINSTMERAAANLNSIIDERNKNHADFCRKASMLSPEAAALLTEAFGSADPND